MSEARITIIGNCGRDPEGKTTTSSKPLESFSVAVSNGRDEDATWYEVTAWSEWLRKRVGEHVRKGVAVTVCGRLKVRDYERKDGTAGYALEISADSVTPHVWRDVTPAAGPDVGDGDNIPW